MAKPLLGAVAAVALVISGYVGADAFSDGMSYGKGQQSTGTNAIKDFKPEEVIPGYTANPPETGYYGGVTSSGVDMTSPGMNELNTSDIGQTITESILNTPADNKPSLDAPFITAGTDMQDNAETVIDPTFDDCQEQNATFTEITTHQCNRTPAVELSCTRTATIGGHFVEDWRLETVTYELSDQPSERVGNDIVATVMPAISGEIVEAYYTWQNTSGNKPRFYMTISVLGTSITWHQKGGETNVSFKASPSTLAAGVPFTSTHPRKVNDGSGSLTYKKHTPLTLRLVIKVKTETWQPEVTWSEACPFDKSEEVLMSSVCTEPGGYKTLAMGGKEYQVYSECWKYKDIYVSQDADNGTCGEYMNNSACTVNGTTCLESLAGVCLSEAATFSCESKVSGTGMMCGGEFFCTDGSCAQGETGTNNMFAQAVSVLAGVAAAGEDIAEFNEADVRAFTGTSQSCRKAMAGFSNCCKDSGWGNDVGLASCSSEEKALGKAKEKKLTVKIGSYCAHKALGVCLEKKERYCQFDSKLAQIVQDQGRRGQLGISFGKASSPDCRGITIDELQSIDFDTLNFASFYSDLEDGTTIPEDSELLEKAKQMIADKVAEAGK